MHAYEFQLLQNSVDYTELLDKMLESEGIDITDHLSISSADNDEQKYKRIRKRSHSAVTTKGRSSSFETNRSKFQTHANEENVSANVQNDSTTNGSVNTYNIKYNPSHRRAISKDSYPTLSDDDENHTSELNDGYETFTEFDTNTSKISQSDREDTYNHIDDKSYISDLHDESQNDSRNGSQIDSRNESHTDSHYGSQIDNQSNSQIDSFNDSYNDSHHPSQNESRNNSFNEIQQEAQVKRNTFSISIDEKSQNNEETSSQNRISNTLPYRDTNTFHDALPYRDPIPVGKRKKENFENGMESDEDNILPTRRAPSPPHNIHHLENNSNLSLDSYSEDEDLKSARRKHRDREISNLQINERTKNNPTSDQSSPRRKRKVSIQQKRNNQRYVYDPLQALDDTVDPQFAEPPKGRQKLRHSPPRRRETSLDFSQMEEPVEKIDQSSPIRSKSLRNSAQRKDTFQSPNSNEEKGDVSYDQYVDYNGRNSPRTLHSVPEQPSVKFTDTTQNVYDPNMQPVNRDSYQFVPPVYQQYFLGYDLYGRPVYSQSYYPPPVDQYQRSANPYGQGSNVPAQVPYQSSPLYHLPQQQIPNPHISQTEHQEFILQQQQERGNLIREMELVKREKEELLHQSNRASISMQNYNSQLSASIQQKEEEIQTLYARVADLENENRQFLESNEILSNDIQSMQSRIDSINQSLKDKAIKLQDTERELLDLKKKTMESGSQLSNLIQKDQQLEETIQDVEANNNKLQKKLDSEIMERRKVEEKLISMEMKQKESQVKIRDLDIELQRKNNEISNMNKQLDSANQEVQKYKHLYQNAQDESEELRSKNEQLLNQLQQSATTTKSDQTTLRQYMQENESLKKELQRLKQQTDHFEKETDYLQTKIKNMGDTIFSLQSQQQNYIRAKEVAISENDRLRVDYDSLYHEREDLMRHINRLEDQLRYFRSDSRETRYSSYSTLPSTQSPTTKSSRILRNFASPSEIPFVTERRTDRRSEKRTYSQIPESRHEEISRYEPAYSVDSHNFPVPIRNHQENLEGQSNSQVLHHPKDHRKSFEENGDYFHTSPSKSIDSQKKVPIASFSPKSNESYDPNIRQQSNEMDNLSTVSSERQSLKSTTPTKVTPSKDDKSMNRSASKQSSVIASENTPFANQHSLKEQVENTAILEKELMDLNIEKNALIGEQQRLLNAQRTMANIRRKNQIESRLEEIAKRQSHIRIRLRNVGAL